MVSRWPTLVSLAVVAGDLDKDRRLTEAAVRRLFAQARAAYFEHSTTLDVSLMELGDSTVQRGSAAVGDDGVSVSVAVVEIFEDSFTMMARLRPVGAGDDVAGTASCVLSPGGPVSTEMRDEFVARAQAARYFH